MAVLSILELFSTERMSLNNNELSSAECTLLGVLCQVLYPCFSRPREVVFMSLTAHDIMNPDVVTTRDLSLHQSVSLGRLS